MRYTTNSGKVINIPNDEIEKSMKALQLTRDEAINLWLEDNEYEINEEQEELDQKAKKIKIKHDAEATKPRKKSEKPRVTKVSDEKKELFDTILTNIDRCTLVERENVSVLKENKLIQVKIGEKVFKIDLIEQRPKKN